MSSFVSYPDGCPPVVYNEMVDKTLWDDYNKQYKKSLDSPEEFWKEKVNNSAGRFKHLLFVYFLIAVM